MSLAIAVILVAKEGVIEVSVFVSGNVVVIEINVLEDSVDADG